MFRKIRLRREIRKCIKLIAYLEGCRSRSQAALVSALLTNTEPADADVDYFNRYTAKINETRERMRGYRDALGTTKDERKQEYQNL